MCSIDKCLVLPAFNIFFDAIADSLSSQSLVYPPRPSLYVRKQSPLRRLHSPATNYLVLPTPQ